MTAPIPFKTTRYRCPHCPRIGASKARITEHMSRCWRNPANRGCKTCAHFEQDPGEPDVGLMGGEGCAVGISLTAPIVGCAKWEPAEHQARLAEETS